MDRAALRLARIGQDVQNESGLDSIRGHEGDAARVYFSVFDHLITAEKERLISFSVGPEPPAPARSNQCATSCRLYTTYTDVHDIAWRA